MKVSARIANQRGEHRVALKTDSREHHLAVAPKPDGFGSSANGGELLFLALATCYCNHLYREARKRGIQVESVEVEDTGEFGATESQRGTFAIAPGSGPMRRTRKFWSSCATPTRWPRSRTRSGDRPRCYLPDLRRAKASFPAPHVCQRQVSDRHTKVMLQVERSWSNLLATMLAVLVAIDLALGLALLIVITRSTADEVRKLWKH